MLYIIGNFYLEDLEKQSLPLKVYETAVALGDEAQILPAYHNSGYLLNTLYSKIQGHNRLCKTTRQVLDESKNNTFLFFKPNYLSKKQIQSLKRRSNLCIWYSGDNPRFDWNITKKNRDALRYFDKLFTVNIENYVKFFQEMNLPVTPLNKSASDSLMCKDSTVSISSKPSVCFVGTGTPLRQEYFSHLSHLLNQELHIYGNRWKPNDRRIFYHQAVEREKLTDIFQSHKYNINLFRLENVDSQNTRLYELLLSRAFIITEKNEITKNLFGEQRFILNDISPYHVAELIGFYESNPKAYLEDQKKILSIRNLDIYTYSSTAKVIMSEIRNLV